MNATTKKVDEYAEARKLIASGIPKAAGYRLLIKPIEVEKGLTEAQSKEFQALADLGFEAKTDGQKEREDRGTMWGIVEDVGEFAYKQPALGGQWCEKGDVVCFKRYEGARFELPPGSGQYYSFVNDEDIFGVIGRKA